MNKVHKGSDYYLHSSHFISAFGNAISTGLTNQNNCQNKSSLIKTPIRTRRIPTGFNQKASDDVTKTKLRAQSAENIKTIKLSTTQNVKRFNEPKEQLNKSLSEKNLGSSGNYYCGGCMNYFADYRGFSLHLRTHAFIIHPSSSHIIVRRKNKPAYALAVKDAQKSTERFSCACSSHKNMSHAEFVEHVFKWHLGITPK